MEATRFPLREGKLSVRRSRTLGEDNPPKTARSARTIPLRPEIVAVLRAMPTPLYRTDDSFFFTNQAGRPLDEERFVEKHWHRALRATGIRPRKFYATRHTFISLTLMAGRVKIKRLADYCGTSIAMIEKHYARWMAERYCGRDRADSADWCRRSRMFRCRPSRSPETIPSRSPLAAQRASVEREP